MASEGNDSSFSMRVVQGTIKKRWPQVKNLSTAELSDCTASQHSGANLAEGSSTMTATSAAASGGTLLLLDTRPTEEYIVSHIQGAVRVDPDGGDVADTAKLVKEEARSKVVCYCSVGYRSTGYANSLQNVLKKDGMTMSVYNLEGSLMKWANEGRPMVDHQGQPTIYCHPYNALWGKLLRSDLRRSTPCQQT